MSPSADLFLAADLHQQLHIHRPGTAPSQAEVSVASVVAALLLALVSLALLFGGAVTSSPPGAPLTPHTTSVGTDPPAPAGVVRMEYDPLR